ncbi:hypothetical protein NN561_005796 [Cricetulus griseus]
MRLAHSAHSPASVLGPPTLSLLRPTELLEKSRLGLHLPGLERAPEKVLPPWKTSRLIPLGTRPWARRPPPREGPPLPSGVPVCSQRDLAQALSKRLPQMLADPFCRELLCLDPFYRWKS